jgi:hypothetical protein
MTKAAIQHMPEYFDRYIALANDVPYMEGLQIGLKELENFPIEKWKAIGDKVYAPGKWTVKDILQHYIDTERIFTYRMLAFARGDQQNMLSFNEDDYAKNTNANNRTIEDLLQELILVRKSFMAMYASFTPEMMLREGNAYNGAKYSVLAMAYMIVGHQRWHFKVVEEKYYPLIS